MHNPLPQSILLKQNQSLQGPTAPFTPPTFETHIHFWRLTERMISLAVQWLRGCAVWCGDDSRRVIEIKLPALLLCGTTTYAQLLATRRVQSKHFQNLFWQLCNLIQTHNFSLACMYVHIYVAICMYVMNLPRLANSLFGGVALHYGLRANCTLICFYKLNYVTKMEIL